eukprot:1155019-Pelagomonas_calceolata.AAC.2
MPKGTRAGSLDPSLDSLEAHVAWTLSTPFVTRTLGYRKLQVLATWSRPCWTRAAASAQAWCCCRALPPLPGCAQCCHLLHRRSRHSGRSWSRSAEGRRWVCVRAQTWGCRQLRHGSVRLH